MRNKDTLFHLIDKWEEMEPGIYDVLDCAESMKYNGKIYWPDYCALPISAAFVYLADKYDYEIAAGVASEITALWIWRKNKIICSFDMDFAQALAKQAKNMQGTEVLPTDILIDLPYPCIYIRVPGLVEHVDGFFVWIEYDINYHRAELRIQWLFEDMEYTYSQVLHILPGKTLRDCFLDTVHTVQKNRGDDIKLQDMNVNSFWTILSAIQLVLYLVSPNAEVERVQRPAAQPGERKGKIIQIVPRAQEDRSNSMEDVEEFVVGVRLGAALRSAAQTSSSGESGTGTAKRSYARRGHWHHYWTGPMGGERTLVLKWTPPTVIHPDQKMEDNIISLSGEK